MRVDEFPAHSSALVSGFFFVGMILTYAPARPALCLCNILRSYGVALPTGLFMPSVLIGVTFGRVAACVFRPVPFTRFVRVTSCAGTFTTC
jgi:H+/Cl- antiporter ClcA